MSSLSLLGSSLGLVTTVCPRGKAKFSLMTWNIEIVITLHTFRSFRRDSHVQGGIECPPKNIQVVSERFL